MYTFIWPGQSIEGNFYNPKLETNSINSLSVSIPVVGFTKDLMY